MRKLYQRPLWKAAANSPLCCATCCIALAGGRGAEGSRSMVGPYAARFSMKTVLARPALISSEPWTCLAGCLEARLRPSLYLAALETK